MAYRSLIECLKQAMESENIDLARNIKTVILSNYKGKAVEDEVNAIYGVPKKVSTKKYKIATFAVDDFSPEKKKVIPTPTIQVVAEDKESPNSSVRIGGVKFLADGSAQERTMRMSTPYVGRPNDYGILTMNQEEIDAAAMEAEKYRFQIGIHANGDLAIDMVLKAFEKVKASGARPGYRPRIEHCSLVNPDLLKRIKAVGAVPLPFYTYAHYHGDKWVEYGPEKMQWMFAHRSFLDYGIPVAPASDYIPGPFEPMMAIQSMVTRKDFKGRVWGPNRSRDNHRRPQ